jgi:hypothetical protein
VHDWAAEAAAVEVAAQAADHVTDQGKDGERVQQLEWGDLWVVWVVWVSAYA